jgi:hypothetical protein
MILDRYELKSATNYSTFQFSSVGPKGTVTKIIQFQKTILSNVYNLAFSDQQNGSNNLDDKVVTDNGDSEKVLATVVASIYLFLNHYPDCWVYATGSTAARTRLYKMGINKYFHYVEKDFTILGDFDANWETYQKGKEYRAFAVQSKTVKFYL